MRYAVCYVEEPDKESDSFEVKTTEYESFLEAVESYTLLCGCQYCSVVLADIETGTVIKQFFKDDEKGNIIIS